MIINIFPAHCRPLHKRTNQIGVSTQFYNGSQQFNTALTDTVLGVCVVHLKVGITLAGVTTKCILANVHTVTDWGALINV